MLVHDVIIFEQMFSDIKMMAFNFLLGILYSPRNQIVLDGLSLFHTQAVHNRCNSFRTKYPEEIILEGKIEARGPRVPLPARSTPKLVINPTTLVSLCPQYVESI